MTVIMKTVYNNFDSSAFFPFKYIFIFLSFSYGVIYDHDTFLTGLKKHKFKKKKNTRVA